MAIDKKKKEAVKTVVKITDAEEKKKALDTAIAYIEKQFGKGAIMKLGEAKAMDIEAIPTGSMTLDMALGIGGVPRGRIIEIYGPAAERSWLYSIRIRCSDTYSALRWYAAFGDENGRRLASFKDTEKDSRSLYKLCPWHACAGADIHYISGACSNGSKPFKPGVRHNRS